MHEGKAKLTNPVRKLPDLVLPPLSGGSPRPLPARPRRSTILLVLHGGGCGECLRYARQVAARDPELREWDGDVSGIVEAPSDAYAADDETPLPFPIFLDDRGTVSAKLSIDAPAVIVADQWREIHAAHDAGPGHHFPDVNELVQWSRYLAIQCPECQGEAL